MLKKVAFVAAAGFALASSNAFAAQVQSNMAVSADVTASCSVTANPLPFGSFTTITTDRDINTSVSLTCTSGVPWTVGISLGNFQSGGVRRMADGSGNFMLYGVYTNVGRTLSFDPIGGANVVTGTGTSPTAQTVNVFGRVPTQTTPATGTYADTLVVTVQY